MSAEAGAIGAAVGLLAVLVPLMLYLHGRLAAEICRGTPRPARRLGGGARRRALTARVDALTERVARIEGAMNPWRPTNGAAVPITPPGGRAVISRGVDAAGGPNGDAGE